jgi:hypothetical protein
MPKFIIKNNKIYIYSKKKKNYNLKENLCQDSKKIIL